MEPRGRILGVLGGLYTVRLDDKETIRCRARGLLRHEGEKPLVGDHVTLTCDGEYSLCKIEQRKNSLIRPPMANLDILFVVMAAARPAPDITTFDKLTAIAEHNGIEPVVIVTKADLAPENAVRLRDDYKKCGFDAFISGIDRDLTELIDYIERIPDGKTCAFSGNSGVGKSAIINRLFPELTLKTGGISRKIQRGRHTTRAVELYPISRGGSEIFVADTPGFSVLDFTRFDFFDADSLVHNFREFAPYLGDCRWADCTHTKEEDCAVIRAVRDGNIPQSRHDSFLAIRADLKCKAKY